MLGTQTKSDVVCCYRSDGLYRLLTAFAGLEAKVLSTEVLSSHINTLLPLLRLSAERSPRWTPSASALYSSA